LSETAVSKPRRRGEPLAALILVAVIWGCFRASSLAGTLPPLEFDTDEGEAPLALAEMSPAPPAPVRRSAPPASAGGEDANEPAAMAEAGEPVMRLALPAAPAARGSRHNDNASTRTARPAPQPRPARTAATAFASNTPVDAVRVPLPPARPATFAQQVPGASSAAAPNPAPASGTGTDDWSGDAWVFWREGSDAPVTPGAQGYGRSQAGAVIRLAMIPASALRPQAYVRVSAALEGPREREVAAGLSARPVPEVPLRLAAEARVTETDFGTELRPAVFAVTEIPPFALPAGLRGETYVQGGYVGGDYDTPFIDGQLGIAREFTLSDTTRLRLGGGVWGGAQRGASRLDVGPSAQMTFRIGTVNARASADYRFRIAGDARPSSGPALTLSASF